MRDREIVEVDVGGGTRIPTMHTQLCLAIVSCRTYVMDGYLIGGDEASEVEELVKVALRWKRDHHHHHLWWFSPVLMVVLVVISHN